MNLVIDLGNTLSKFASFSGDKLITVKKFGKNSQTQQIDHLKKIEFSSVIISTVIGEPAYLFDYLKNIKVDIVLFNNECVIPLTNKYRSKTTLGNDRLALAVGGYYIFPDTNVLIIDTGTCITYDIVTEKREYLGGAISPGVSLRFKSLNYFTQNLPLVKQSKIDKIIGATTNQSILSGVINGIIMEINGFIDEFSSEFKDLNIILSGGDTKLLSGKLKNCNFVDSNLQLYGLNQILILNENL